MPRFFMDSTKIRIRKDLVQIKEPQLQNTLLKIIIDTETGEEYSSEEFKKNAFPVEYDGIKTKYLIEQIQGSEYVCILFNSKLLKSDYSKGITIDTIFDIYTELMTQNVIYLDFKDFIEGALTDIDFATDFKINPHYEIELCNKLSCSTLDKSKVLMGRKFEHTNIGIQWGKRKGARPTAPFVKFYSKHRELDHHSIEFRDKHLVRASYEDTMRLEYTIKDKRHLGLLFKSIGNRAEVDNSLWGVLSISQLDLQRFGVKILERHLDFKGLGMKKFEVINKLGLTPSESVLLSLITGQIEAGVSLGVCIDNAIRGVNGAPNKTKWRQKLERLINNTPDVLIPDDKKREYYEINDVFKMLFTIPDDENEESSEELEKRKFEQLEIEYEEYEKLDDA